MTSSAPETRYQKHAIHKTSIEKILKGSRTKYWDCITLSDNTITFKQNSNLSNDKLKEVWRFVLNELNKQKWRRLESLTIEFLECQDLNDEAFTQLRFDQFKNFRNLQALQIRFIKCSISDVGLQNITRNICVGVRDIQKLSILFSQSENYFQGSLELLGVQIHKYLTKIKDLSIAFYYGNIVNKGVKKLGKSIIKNLRELKRLSITFYSCQIGDESLGLFESGFNWKLNHLEQLKVNFAKCANITNDGLETLSKDMTKRFPNLRDLILNFTTCEKITDDGFKALTSQIGDHWPNLARLSLLFDDCEEITDVGVKSLSQDVISKANQMENLYLSFSSFEGITDEALCSLSQSISTRQNLRHLGLSFYGCLGLTSAGFDSVNKDICGSLRNMQNLYLNFSACNIEDAWVTALSSQLSAHMNSLKELDLRLSFCEAITDESIKDLFNVVTRDLPHLETLALNIFECIKVGQDKLLAQEEEREVNLPKLKELNLDYARCSPDVSDKTLDWLNSHIIKKLTALRNLTLKFSCYENITDVGLNKLALEIKETHSKLQQLTLDFAYSTQITKEAEANVKQIVEFVPKQDVKIVA